MHKTPVTSWFDKNTVKLLRFPFSFFLLPVFLFALSQTATVNWATAILAFIILHFLIFPSSNGYNSYQDKDETSIGGLKNPPKVTKNLFYATVLFDVAGVLLGLLVSGYFAFFILIFIAISRMYSYRGIRLKKYPFAAFAVVFIFQGGFVYLMTAAAAAPFSFSFFASGENLLNLIISSLFIGSMYPLTQIYQHDADKNDGVVSLSYKLGYRGTFVFSAILFMAATVLLFFQLNQQNQLIFPLLFLLFILPVVVHLSKWFALVRKNSRYANFENTMKANFLASTGMNAFFLVLIINNQLTLF